MSPKSERRFVQRNRATQNGTRAHHTRGEKHCIQVPSDTSLLHHTSFLFPGIRFPLFRFLFFRQPSCIVIVKGAFHTRHNSVTTSLVLSIPTPVRIPPPRTPRLLHIRDALRQMSTLPSTPSLPVSTGQQTILASMMADVRQAEYTGRRPEFGDCESSLACPGKTHCRHKTPLKCPEPRAQTTSV